MYYRRNLAAALAAAIVLGTAFPAKADEGWYVGGFGGVSFLENLQLAHGDELRSPEFIVCSDSIRPETCQTIIPPPSMIRRSTTSDFDTGLTAGLTAGIDLASTFRGELEFVFSNNTIEHARTGPLPDLYKSIFIQTDPPNLPQRGSNVIHSASGDISTYSLLINGWFDVPLETAIKPYVGGGIGLAIVDANLSWGSTAPPPVSLINNGYNFTDIGFAFQAGAGVRLPVTERITIDLGYRYRNITGIKFKPKVASLPAASPDLGSHNVQIGVTFKLGE